MLRDFFVLGIGHETILCKPLTVETPNLSKAITIAQAFISTSDNTKQILQNKEVSASTVHKVTSVLSRNVQGRTYTPAAVARPQLTQSPESSVNAKQLTSCWRCGGDHRPHQCHFKHYACNGCRTMGHLQRMCRRAANPANHHVVEKDRSTVDQTELETRTEEAEVYGVHTFMTKCPPIMLKVELNGIPVSMELDTGASQSIMSKMAFDMLWGKKAHRPKLSPIHTKLRTYTKELIPVIGSAEVKVSYDGAVHELPLWIVPGDGPTLFGRSWLGENPLELGRHPSAFIRRRHRMYPGSKQFPFVIQARHWKLFGSESADPFGSRYETHPPQGSGGTIHDG
uniref:uncharacterized protein n=1 Tax=Pristiophorus japonicus TaxID=55135 RepID=UPI00398E8028